MTERQFFKFGREGLGLKNHPRCPIQSKSYILCLIQVQVAKKSFSFLYLAVAVLGSNGQNETVTFATCFREAPLIAAILNRDWVTCSLLMTSHIKTCLSSFGERESFERPL